MKKIIAIIGILLLVIFAYLNSNVGSASNSKSFGIYFDGQRIQTNIEPQIINGRMLLPLRATFHLFDTPVYWEPKSNSIRATIGDQAVVLKLNQDQAKIYNGLINTDVFLDQAPVIISNRVFVPIRFIADIFNCGVKYDQGTKRVNIDSPLIFKNNQWYVKGFENNILIPIKKHNYANYIKQENTTYFVLHVGDLTMYKEILYSLDSKGNAKQIFSDRISAFKIEGDNIFYIDESVGLLSLNTLMKVNLSNPLDKKRLGNPDFAYDAQVKIRKSKDEKNIYFNLVAPNYKWEVKPDGIYILAFNTKMNIEDRVVDLPLLEKSHGYYLVDKNGRGQRLVKNIKIDKQF